MHKRRQFVSFQEEWDMESDPNLQLGNLEDLLIKTEEEQQEQQLNTHIAEMIERAISSLSEPQHSIIIIRYFLEGEDRYTAQQLADILGIARKTYYNHLNKALEKLKCLLIDDLASMKND